MEQQLSIQSNSHFLPKKKQRRFPFSSGTCKQIPGLKLQNGDLPDEDFEFLRQYLLKSAYTDKEVYNVHRKSIIIRINILVFVHFRQRHQKNLKNSKNIFRKINSL